MNNELTAALATIEKCREITNCPAGVDLQDHLRQLAAENVGLKDVSVKLFNMGYRRGHESTVESCYVDIHWSDIGEYHEDIVAEIIEDETPATDRIVAEAEARGIEKGIAHLEKKFSNIGVQIMNLQWLADSLCEGVK